MEGVGLSTYQLKDVAYNWYEYWEKIRGNNSKSTLWNDFSYDVLDNFFTQDLRE